MSLSSLKFSPLLAHSRASIPPQHTPELSTPPTIASNMSQNADNLADADDLSQLFDFHALERDYCAPTSSSTLNASHVLCEPLEIKTEWLLQTPALSDLASPDRLHTSSDDDLSWLNGDMHSQESLNALLA